MRCNRSSVTGSEAETSLYRIHWVLVAAGFGLLPSCVSYEPEPLVPEEVIEEVLDLRRAPDGVHEAPDGPVFTLPLAARWMREHGPSVAEAVAAYETALARAQVATPFPNPGLEVGPQWGYGSDVDSVHQVTAFGSIGFAIPTGGRLSRQDELNEARAEVARIDGLARHRELYLELRTSFTTLVIARARERLQEEIAEAARRTVDVTLKLVDAGVATALDVALFQLEHARRLADKYEAEQATVRTETTLSKIIGVNAVLFASMSESPLPAMPSDVPDIETLRGIQLSQHPALGRLRARYEQAERSLRLEISKQYPDLRLGPFYEGETGEKKHVLGLTLGLELPLFDRNQQAIAEALKYRTQVRVQYEAAANRAQAELEGAHHLLNLTVRRRQLLETETLPRAQASIRIAHESLTAGSGDALRLLDAERSQREIQLEVLNAELDEWEAWTALEQAVGFPLMNFPSEGPEDAAGDPEGLEPRSEAAVVREEDSR